MKGRKEVEESVLQHIEDHGWEDMFIFPRQGDPGVVWNYSVGLTHTYSHPELVVMGLPQENAHGVLWAAVHLIEDGFRFTPDSLVEEVLANHPVAVVEVLDVHNDNYPLSMATSLFGDISALQLVWPDMNGLFPWDNGFEPALKDAQVMLGPWLGAKK